MSEASELRRDSEKYLQRCRERGMDHIDKMTPEELAAFDKRLREYEGSLGNKPFFFDVHEKVRNNHRQGEK
ncbi:MAG: hypothetical protein J6Y54_06785 [Lentisphaeria bacterium]|nr:hypothetical protein [Lentisphaeria bacterium]